MIDGMAYLHDAKDYKDFKYVIKEFGNGCRVCLSIGAIQLHKKQYQEKKNQAVAMVDEKSGLRSNSSCFLVCPNALVANIKSKVDCITDKMVYVVFLVRQWRNKKITELLWRRQFSVDRFHPKSGGEMFVLSKAW